MSVNTFQGNLQNMSEKNWDNYLTNELNFSISSPLYFGYFNMASFTIDVYTSLYSSASSKINIETKDGNQISKFPARPSYISVLEGNVAKIRVSEQNFGIVRSGTESKCSKLPFPHYDSTVSCEGLAPSSRKSENTHPNLSKIRF